MTATALRIKTAAGSVIFGMTRIGTERSAFSCQPSQLRCDSPQRCRNKTERDLRQFCRKTTGRLQLRVTTLSILLLMDLFCASGAVDASTSLSNDAESVHEGAGIGTKDPALAGREIDKASLSRSASNDKGASDVADRPQQPENPNLENSAQQDHDTLESPPVKGTTANSPQSNMQQQQH